MLLREVIDVARLYRDVRALPGHTCVVERVSRQLWRLRLAGASDPASPLLPALLAETPTPYRLGANTRQSGGSLGVGKTRRVSLGIASS